MIKIVTFEGADYSGKTTTFKYMAKEHAQNSKVVFNEGPIYPNDLTARLLIIANQADEIQREFLYSMIFMQDFIISKINEKKEERVFIQDRYWPSVVAYGRFINKGKSLHNIDEFRKMFIIPSATLHFYCSYDERMKRSKKRERKSVLDNLLLNSPKEFERLEQEIEESSKGLPNVLKINTTDKKVEEVADIVKQYLISLNLL